MFSFPVFHAAVVDVHRRENDSINGSLFCRMVIYFIGSVDNVSSNMMTGDVIFKITVKLSRSVKMILRHRAMSPARDNVHGPFH